MKKAPLGVCRIDPQRLAACRQVLGLPPAAGLSLVLRQWGLRE